MFSCCYSNASPSLDDDYTQDELEFSGSAQPYGRDIEPDPSVDDDEPGFFEKHGYGDYFSISNKTLNLDEECLMRKSFGQMAANFKACTHNYGSHPHTAGERTSARRALGAWCAKRDLVPYVVDMSLSDQHLRKKDKIFGSHFHHTPKDAAHEIAEDDYHRGDVYMMVDSDYYHEDMQWFLTRKPCVLYTCMPDEIAYEGKEYCYSFGDHDTLRYTSSSGNVYKHKVWNWRTDGLDIKTWFGVLHVKVEYIKVSPSHYMVITIPTSWTRTLFWNPFSTPIEPLSRYKVASQGHNVMLTMQDSEGSLTSFVSIAPVGASRCATLPLALYQAAATNYAMSSAKALHNIDTIVEPYYKNDPYAKVYKVIVRSAICAGVVIPNSRPHVTGCHAPPPGPMLELLGDDDLPQNPAHEKAQLLGNPVIRGAVVPTPNSAAATLAVANRIVKVKAPITDPSVLAHFTPLADEFNAEFSRVSPLSVGEVNKRLKKKSQRTDFERVAPSMFENPKPTSSFIKVEPQGTANKDPRVISQLSKENKILWSKFTLAAADTVKPKRWYGFSKNPAAIAERVTRLASANGTNSLVMTDFSRFDGTRSSGIAQLELNFMLSLFSDDHHEEIKRLFNSELNINGYIEDQKYEVGYARLSGSPDTSLLNSYTNALMAYLTARECGMTHSAAWKNLGLYGGDDGMTPNVDVATYKAVTAKFGLRLTVESANTPDQPLTFLARTYPTPHLSPGSTCDILRALAKIHIGVGTLVPKTVAIARKYVGIMATDANTPVIRDVLASLRLCLTDTDVGKAMADSASYSYAQQNAVDNGAYPAFEDDDAVFALLEENSGVSSDAWANYGALLREIPFDIHDLAPIMDNTVLPLHNCTVGGEYHSGSLPGPPPAVAGPEQSPGNDVKLPTPLEFPPGFSPLDSAPPVSQTEAKRNHRIELLKIKHANKTRKRKADEANPRQTPASTPQESTAAGATSN